MLQLMREEKKKTKIRYENRLHFVTPLFSAEMRWVRTAIKGMRNDKETLKNYVSACKRLIKWNQSY